MAISGRALRAGRAVIEMSLVDGRLQKQLASLVKRFRRLGATLNNIGTLGVGRSGFGGLYALLVGSQAVRALAFPVQLAGNLEVASAHFTAFTGSAEEAKRVISELEQFSKISIVSLPELEKAATTLLGYGTNVDDVVPAVKSLTAVARGNTVWLQRLALAYGQTQAKSRLYAQEVRQFTEAGFNPLQAIMERTGETMLEVRERMEAGAIGANEVTAALVTATSAGGRFGSVLGEVAKTTFGLWSRLKATAMLAVRPLGQHVLPALRDMLRRTNELVPALAKMIRQNTSWYSSLLLLVGGLIATGAALVTAGFSIQILAFSAAGLLKVLTLLTSTLYAFTLPVRAAVASLTLLQAAMFSLRAVTVAIIFPTRLLTAATLALRGATLLLSTAIYTFLLPGQIMSGVIALLATGAAGTTASLGVLSRMAGALALSFTRLVNGFSLVVGFLTIKRIMSGVIAPFLALKAASIALRASLFTLAKSGRALLSFGKLVLSLKAGGLAIAAFIKSGGLLRVLLLALAGTGSILTSSFMSGLLGVGLLSIGLLALASAGKSVGPSLVSSISSLEILTPLLSSLNGAYSRGKQAAMEWGSYLSDRFKEVQATAIESFTAIGNAMAAGELQAAIKVAWEGIKLVWAEGTRDLQDQWIDFKHSFLQTTTEMVFGFQESFLKMFADVRKMGTEFSDWWADLWDLSTNPFADEDDPVWQRIVDRERARRTSGNAIDAELTAALDALEAARETAAETLSDGNKKELDAHKKALIEARKAWEAARDYANSLLPESLNYGGEAGRFGFDGGLPSASESVGKALGTFDARFAGQLFSDRQVTVQEEQKRILEGIEDNTEEMIAAIQGQSFGLLGAAV